ncbi:hypothetical protein TRFO_20938 [Tritrichomonas foetus]|uniref:Uncharacterized protein n=1 Tax=Tritrichomonas foetus TaxID=1144522 RepID=A0A1J4KK09_9EUKA|nr:hypothetical protein TRFO_20938 [Tritrichomonas foetus]|eukprot:OHT10022.1 hypothetical protein TRFO_20938 [Tritrichomonas foetus]
MNDANNSLLLNSATKKKRKIDDFSDSIDLHASSLYEQQSKWTSSVNRVNCGLDQEENDLQIKLVKLTDLLNRISRRLKKIETNKRRYHLFMKSIVADFKKSIPSQTSIIEKGQKNDIENNDKENNRKVNNDKGQNNYNENNQKGNKEKSGEEKKKNENELDPLKIRLNREISEFQRMINDYDSKLSRINLKISTLDERLHHTLDQKNSHLMEIDRLRLNLNGDSDFFVFKSEQQLQINEQIQNLTLLERKVKRLQLRRTQIQDIISQEKIIMKEIDKNKHKLSLDIQQKSNMKQIEQDLKKITLLIHKKNADIETLNIKLISLEQEIEVNKQKRNKNEEMLKKVKNNLNSIQKDLDKEKMNKNELIKIEKESINLSKILVNLYDELERNYEIENDLNKEMKKIENKSSKIDEITASSISFEEKKKINNLLTPLQDEIDNEITEKQTATAKINVKTSEIEHLNKDKIEIAKKYQKIINDVDDEIQIEHNEYKNINEINNEDIKLIAQKVKQKIADRIEKSKRSFLQLSFDVRRLESIYKEEKCRISNRRSKIEFVKQKLKDQPDNSLNDEQQVIAESISNTLLSLKDEFLFWNEYDQRGAEKTAYNGSEQGIILRKWISKIDSLFKDIDDFYQKF